MKRETTRMKNFLTVWMFDKFWFLFVIINSNLSVEFSQISSAFLYQVLMKVKSTKSNANNSSQFWEINQCLFLIILNCKFWYLFKKTHHYEFSLQCQFYCDNQRFFSNCWTQSKNVFAFILNVADCFNIGICHWDYALSFDEK